MFVSVMLNHPRPPKRKKWDKSFIKYPWLLNQERLQGKKLPRTPSLRIAMPIRKRGFATAFCIWKCVYFLYELAEKMKKFTSKTLNIIYFVYFFKIQKILASLSRKLVPIIGIGWKNFSNKILGIGIRKLLSRL